MAAPDGSPTWRVARLAETGSTNADARAGAVSGTLDAGDVLVAELQTAGRGRLDRSWISRPGTGITFSALLRPVGVPDARWGWLPLLAGLAVLDAATTAVAGVRCGLKWPNDVLGADGRKLAGVLCERVDGPAGPLAVVGIGINVSATAADLPVPEATSLALAGGTDLDRDRLLTAVLDALGARSAAWSAAGGDAERCGLAADYRAASATIGAAVTVTRADGSRTDGTAVGLDANGALRLDAGGAEQVVAAGDVTHVRGGPGWSEPGTP